MQQANPILEGRFVDYTSLASKLGWSSKVERKSAHGRWRIDGEWTELVCMPSPSHWVCDKGRRGLPPWGAFRSPTTCAAMASGPMADPLEGGVPFMDG